jgi:hypothetical protein
MLVGTSTRGTGTRGPPPTDRPSVRARALRWPGRSRSAIGRPAMIALFLAALILSIGILAVYLSPVAPGPPVTGTVIAVTVHVNASAPPVSLGSSFYGVNAIAEHSLGPVTEAAVNATEARLVRWPGGDLGERYDPLADQGAGAIFNDSGGVNPAPASPAAFVAWCRSIRCAAIVTLPAEIDNATLAGAIVADYTQNFSFHPAYWEIGNEPARWTHFGIPWSSWSISQNSTVTPGVFAAEVQRYVTAIRAVDPTTPIIGLGGVGTGSTNEVQWISSVVSVNGPNLSAIAIHVYPAGAGVLGENLSSFYASLAGSASLPIRVPADRAAISAACSTCAVRLMVDELGAGTGANLSALLGGFPIVPYVAAEILQGARLGVGTMAYWSLESNFPGAWLDVNGTPRPSYPLYATLLAGLPDGVLPTEAVAAVSGLYALGFAEPGTGTNASLVVVNANPTVSFRLGPSTTGFPVTSPYQSESWNGSTSAPVSQSWGAGSTPIWTLPPGAVVVWRSSAGAHFALAHAALHYSENSSTSPGSIVPNASVVKYCLIALVTGQIGIQRSPAPQRSRRV